MTWPLVELGTIAKVESGFGFPREDQGDTSSTIPFFKVGDMNLPGNTKEMTEWTNTVSDEVLKKLRAKSFPKGTIIFPKIGAAIATGKKRILSCDATFDNNVMGLVPTASVDPGFLYYWTLTYDFTSISNVGPVPSIRKSAVENLKIPLPPLTEQRRIVEVLDQADALRRQRAEADAKAARILPALFYQMFGDPATNPMGWPVVPLTSLFPSDRPGTRSGPFGSSLKKHEYVETGIPVWGIDNVLFNRFVEANSLFITKQKFAELTNYEVEPGDILISRAGTVGRMCVARPHQSPSIIGTNLIRLSIDQTKVIPEYIASLLSYSSRGPGHLRAASDNSAYSFMNPAILRSVTVPLPPLPPQQQFAYRTAETLTLGDDQTLCGGQLDTIFQTLLRRAFTGNLTAR